MLYRKIETYMRIVFIAAALAPAAISAQEIPKAVKAVQLTGLQGVKENAKGTLSVENGNLHFVHGKGSSDVNIKVILDVATGTDNHKAVGNTVGTISMAAPYGGGRFLSLFRKKIDTLTVEYRDVEGAFHGVIFTTPSGTAELLKKELVAQGAHTTVPPAQESSSHDPSSTAVIKEQKR